MKPVDQKMAVSADEALARLISGNRRFHQGESRTAGFSRETLAELSRGQQPYATILGCSDSRVPPEWVFDAGPGDLFVVRVAGNVYSREIGGSLQYAAAHLQTPLFVVLGHEGCGAVSAALDTMSRGARDPSRGIKILVDTILPGLPALEERLSARERLTRAIEANVRWTVRQILRTPEAQEQLDKRWMKMLGAVYEIESGRVRFLPDSREDFAPSS